MYGLLMILAAGAVGALARFLVSRALPTLARPTRVPRAVLIVNVVGSAIAGLGLALGVTHLIPDGIAIVIVTGLCGGLTTFSTFSVETLELFLQGGRSIAWRSIAANTGYSVVATALGFVPIYLAFS